MTISALKGYHNIVSHLIACNADVDEKNIHNQTALHMASEGGHMEVVKVLLKACSEINVVDISQSTPLMLAVSEGHHDVVSHLIVCNANVDNKNLHNRTALHIASERGHVEIVNALLIAHAKIDEVDRSLSTPLMLAAREGHHDIVGRLITCGASVDGRDQYYRTALHYASKEGNIEVVKTLLNAGVNIDEVDESHLTPLMMAVHESHQHVVSHLINCSASVDRKDKYNRTALHIASERGHMEMVNALLIADAKIDEVDRSLSTPLMLAAREGHHDIVGYLITCGASVDRHDQYYRTALHYASKEGKIEAVKTLLSERAKIDEVDESQLTPLMMAVHESHQHVVSHLINCSASVDRKDKYNRTALHIASERGHMEMVNALLIADAKIDEVDRSLSTPLMLAAREGHQLVVSHLILCKANVDKKNLHNQTALHMASGKGHMEVVKALLKVCAEIDVLDGSRSTPLMLAACGGHHNIVGHLITCGASVNKKDPYNQTALHYVSKRGNIEIVKTLLNAGAKIDVADDNHFTPLMLATYNKHADIISYLLYAEMIKQDVNSLRRIASYDLAGYVSSGSTLYKVNITQLSILVHLNPISHVHLDMDALSYAVNQKYKHAAKVLITNGVGIEGLLSTSPPMTTLMWTAQEGYYSLTEQLILQGVNVNYQNPDGRTALHFAACSGRLEVVQILLNNGAEIDLEDKHHHTPLVLSVEAKKYDVMLHLITSGADVTQLAKHPDRDFGRDALSYAVNHKHKDVAKILITKGVCIEGLLGTKFTALMWTAKMGDAYLTKHLILKGVNISYRNREGHAALHFAAQHNHIQCGILLVEAGADVNIVNNAFQTPLDLCSNEFKDAILQTLSFQTKKTVCVIGNALSGKSTLIASLKNENAWFWARFFNRLFGVQDISERTAGIEIVSLSSKRYGDVMFFDFAGQHEYHGPHEIFLESILSKGLSTVTIIVVVKVTEEESAICHQLNRWLHPFAKLSSSTNPVRVIVIGSHMDEVKRKAEAKEKLELCYETVKDSLPDVPVKFEDLCYLDCRQPYSNDISKLCKYLKDVPPPQYKDVHIGYSIPWVITRIHSSIDEKVISVAEFSDWIALNQANLPTNLPPAEEVCKDLSSTGHFLYLPSKEGSSNGWLVLDLPSILHEVYGTLFSPLKKIVNKFGLLNYQRLSVLFPTLDPSMIRDVLISLEFCIEVDPSILSGSTHLMDSSNEGLEHLFFPAMVSTEPPVVFSEDFKENHILCWQLEVSENSFLSPRLLQTIILQLAAHHVFHYKRGFKNREHYCSVWWNGIFWRSTKDADVAVKISDNAVVQVIGRSAVSPEGLCMYISRVIQDIFDTTHRLSPHLSGTAYIIHPVNPQVLLESPKSPSPQEMFPVDFILESRRNGGSRCLSCNAVEEKAVSDVFGGYQPSVDVVERFSMSACECVLVYIIICPYVYIKF